MDVADFLGRVLLGGRPGDLGGDVGGDRGGAEGGLLGLAGGGELGLEGGLVDAFLHLRAGESAEAFGIAGAGRSEIALGGGHEGDEQHL